MDKFRNLLAQAMCVVCLLACASQAHAALMRSDVDPALYVEYAQDPTFDSVGWFAGTLDGTWTVRGSAVLIDPEWVLTAGHSLFSSDGSVATDIYFSRSSSIYTDPPNYTAANGVYFYPGYTSGTAIGTGVDLALVHLSSGIYDVTPATLYTGVDARGTLMSMAGYGTPGTEVTGLGTFDGIKRAGDNVASYFGGDSPALLDVESQYWVAPFLWERTTTQPLEWMSTPGDSGGGWFADVNGEMQLVGINIGNMDGYTYHGSSIALRTSLYNDWIYDTMDAHSTVPEPSSLIIFGSGMLGLIPLARKRRRASA